MTRVGAAHHKRLRHEQQNSTTKCDREDAKKNIVEQVAKLAASCTMCQPPARQRFLAATGSRSVDYAVPRPKRRERYGDERRSATIKDLPSMTRCWVKVTPKAVARKRQAMVQMTNRSLCCGGWGLAGTSFLQLSSSRALVVDGTKGLQKVSFPQQCVKRQLVGETCTLHFETHVEPSVYRQGGARELRRTI